MTCGDAAAEPAALTQKKLPITLVRKTAVRWASSASRIERGSPTIPAFVDQCIEPAESLVSRFKQATDVFTIGSICLHGQRAPANSMNA